MITIPTLKNMGKVYYINCMLNYITKLNASLCTHMRLYINTLEEETLKLI